MPGNKTLAVTKAVERSDHSKQVVEQTENYLSNLDVKRLVWGIELLREIKVCVYLLFLFHPSYAPTCSECGCAGGLDGR